jgi:hypothetical protein
MASGSALALYQSFSFSWPTALSLARVPLPLIERYGTRGWRKKGEARRRGRVGARAVTSHFHEQEDDQCSKPWHAEPQHERTALC